MNYNLSEIYWAYSKDGNLIFPFVKYEPYKILNLDTNEYYNFTYCKHLEPNSCLKSLISMTHKSDIEIKRTQDLFLKLNLPKLTFLKCFAIALTNLEYQTNQLQYADLIETYCRNKVMSQNKLMKLKNFFKKALKKNQALEK